jgi:hypothetical protein
LFVLRWVDRRVMPSGEKAARGKFVKRGKRMTEIKTQVEKVLFFFNLRLFFFYGKCRTKSRLFKEKSI